MIPAFSDLKGMAQRQVQRHGVQSSYVVEEGAVYNPATSSVQGGTSTTYTFKAFPAKASYSETQQPNLVNVDIKVFLVSASDLTVKPKLNSKITVGSDSFTVLRVTEHWAHGEVVLWRILTQEG